MPLYNIPLALEIRRQDQFGPLPGDIEDLETDLKPASDLPFPAGFGEYPIVPAVAGHHRPVTVLAADEGIADLRHPESIGGDVLDNPAKQTVTVSYIAEKPGNTCTTISPKKYSSSRCFFPRVMQPHAFHNAAPFHSGHEFFIDPTGCTTKIDKNHTTACGKSANKKIAL